MEDPKGLEVVLLLSAVVIKEVYFRQIRDAFNIIESPKPKGSDIKSQDSLQVPSVTSSQQNVSSSKWLFSDYGRDNASLNTRPPLRIQTSNPRPPPTDPRSQWEIDAETARLKKQVQQEEQRRKRAEIAEAKRTQQMLEAEEREARRKQDEIDKETERLRKEYMVEQRRLEQRKKKPILPPRHSIPEYTTPPPAQYQHPGGPYLQPSGLYGNASSSGFFQGQGLRPEPNKKVRGKSSFFGLRNRSEDDVSRLLRKQSSVF